MLALLVLFYKEGGGEFFATEPPSEGHTAYKCKKGGLEPPAKLWCLRQQHSTSYMKFSAQVVHFYKILKLYIFYYKFKAIDYYFFNLQLGKAIHKHRQTNRGVGCPPIIFNMISHVKILLNFTPYLNESMVLPPPQYFGSCTLLYYMWYLYTFILHILLHIEISNSIKRCYLQKKCFLPQFPGLSCHFYVRNLANFSFFIDYCVFSCYCQYQ